MIKYFFIILICLFSVLLLVFSNETKSNIGEGDRGRKIETIIIDPGHGGKDPGTTGLSGIYEKNVVLDIGLKVKSYLADGYGDIKVVMTRDKDEFIELKNRGVIANENDGDLFVSIHCNARKNEENDKNGFEIYLLDLARINEAIEITYSENKFPDFQNISLDTDRRILKRLESSLLQNVYMKNGTRFSDILQTEIIKGTKLESRGIRQAGFYVLLGASMPTVLIESGYLSNRSDEEYLKSEKGKNEIAKSIYKAIRYYKFDYDFENMSE
jgi:N-acetylmuramoyl-L-alanine amidase